MVASVVAKRDRGSQARGWPDRPRTKMVLTSNDKTKRRGGGMRLPKGILSNQGAIINEHLDASGATLERPFRRFVRQIIMQLPTQLNVDSPSCLPQSGGSPAATRRNKTNRPMSALNTITMCHLLLILIIEVVPAFTQSNRLEQLYGVARRGQIDAVDTNSAPIQMPAYTPTRAPHPSSASSTQHQVRQSSNNNNNHHHQSESHLDKRQQQQAKHDLDPKVTSGSTKFTRTNELEAFLDEMSHNELRDLASGKEIKDLFKPKLLNGGSADGSYSESRKHEQGGGGRALEESGSEQQIYSECALILQRTYVKNINDPKHQLVPFGKTEQACISYKHIDKAIEQAKHQLKFKEFSKQRKKASKSARKPLVPFEAIHSSLEPPEDIVAAIGEINMATTQIIANQFDLSNDELLNGLPLIDMSKTKFWSICPLLVKQDIKCEITRFRTHTGHCNNLKHPTWGAAMTPFARYLPPVHPDGIWIPRKSVVSDITFDLGEGHRETHSNIAPTMPAPVFEHHHHLHHHRHHHHHLVGRSSAQSQNRAVDELAASGSVQFVSRANYDGYPGGSSLSVEHSSMVPAPESSRLAEPPAPAIQSHHTSSSYHQGPIPVHYQQSHSPGRPYLATATPLKPNQGALVAAPAASNDHKLTAAASLSHKSQAQAQELPSARLVTSIVHRDTDLPSHDFTILFMSWGQLLDHDMTRAAQPPASIKCCGQERSKHKLCLPIHVPPNDPFYSKFNVKCLEFRRSLAGVRPNCVLGPRVHQNAITSPIDANFVYGSSLAQAEALRLFKGGRLRDRNWFKREQLKPLLPAQEIEPDLECIARPKDLFCFLAGDVRANEQTHLTVLHTLYMREHNRIADKLSELNPHWDDERTYHETRHIVAAGVQHVMINEYIPLLIGKKMTELYNLTAQAHDSSPNPAAFWHGYDPTVTTSVSNSFAAAAFRQGHTFVQGSVERYNKFHEFVASEKLRHLFKQPFLIYQPGVLDELTGGMINQPSQSYDPFISADISGHLFQPPESQFGHDLAAINLQRGREQGLPGYNLFREWCGLPRAESFEQLEPYLTNQTAFQYSRLYKHVDDIDLWSGGVSERKLPGAAIGPTFACIIARQFSNTRRGDRFWYENPGLPSSFQPEQLAEIRKISLAKILCANSDELPTIQRWALRMAHPVLNPRLPCHQLPEPNLHFWQEE